MLNFEIDPKTKIVFGKDAECKAGEEIARFTKKCMLCHDGSPFLEPLLNRVKDGLTAAGVEYIEMNKIQVLPKLSIVKEAAEICRNQGVGFVLGIGGGAAMDTTKVTALAVNYKKGDIVDFDPVQPVDWEVLPHGAIPTLTGTGSEMSFGGIIANDEKEPIETRGYGHPVLCNDVIFVNPELTYSLPPRQTAAGTMDLMSHAMEHYFNDTEDSFITDGYCEAIIKTALICGLRVILNPKDYNARANLSICAMMANSAHMALNCASSDWCVHNIEGALEAKYKATHGAILAVLTPQWVRIAYKNNPRRFRQWAVNCMGVEPKGSDDEIILKAADLLQDWVTKMGLPTHLADLGIDGLTLEEDAAKAIRDVVAPADSDESVFGNKKAEPRLGGYSQLTYDQILAILKAAL